MSDLEGAIASFTYGFGMEVVHTQVQDNPYSRSLVGEPEARFRVPQLRFTEGTRPQSGHLPELDASGYAPWWREASSPVFRPGSSIKKYGMQGPELVDTITALNELL